MDSKGLNTFFLAVHNNGNLMLARVKFPCGNQAEGLFPADSSNCPGPKYLLTDLEYLFGQVTF